MKLRQIAIGVVLLAALSTSACSSGGTPDTDGGSRMASSLTALIQMDLDREGLSAQNRALLEQAAEEGGISAALYEQAAREYQRCVTDLGNDVRWDTQPDGSYLEVPLTSVEAELDKYWEDSSTCAEDGFSSIQ